MPYNILPYTYDRAKEHGLTIYPSENGVSKLDVYKDGHFIASIGTYKMADYPTYMEYERRGLVDKGYADKRRELYYKRHNKDYGYLSKDWLSKTLLW